MKKKVLIKTIGPAMEEMEKARNEEKKRVVSVCGVEVKSAKDGGYRYRSTETGARVSPEEFERVYRLHICGQVQLRRHEWTRVSSSSSTGCCVANVDDAECVSKETETDVSREARMKKKKKKNLEGEDDAEKKEEKKEKKKKRRASVASAEELAELRGELAGAVIGEGNDTEPFPALPVGNAAVDNAAEESLEGGRRSHHRHLEQGEGEEAAAAAATGTDSLGGDDPLAPVMKEALVLADDAREAEASSRKSPTEDGDEGNPDFLLNACHLTTRALEDVEVAADRYASSLRQLTSTEPAASPSCSNSATTAATTTTTTNTISSAADHPRAAAWSIRREIRILARSRVEDNDEVSKARAQADAALEAAECALFAAYEEAVAEYEVKVAAIVGARARVERKVLAAAVAELEAEEAGLGIPLE